MVSELPMKSQESQLLGARLNLLRRIHLPKPSEYDHIYPSIKDMTNFVNLTQLILNGILGKRRRLSDL